MSAEFSRNEAEFSQDEAAFSQDEKVKRLFECIGNIDDSFITEAKTVDIASEEASRKRFYKYGALTAAFGLAVTYWWMRSKPTA